MYHLIEAQIPLVLQAIPKNEVGDYVSLVQKTGQVGAQGFPQGFEDEYRDYWAKGWRRTFPNFPSPQYWTAYFQTLQAAVQTQTPPNLPALATNLYNIEPKLQFSFATKLLHMVGQYSPIYDSKVAAFYLFQPPTRPTWQQRLQDLVNFHTFLVQEYSRVINNGFLRCSIQAFRQAFVNNLAPQQQGYVTNQRIIDLLIWAYVDGVQSGILNRQLVYY